MKFRLKTLLSALLFVMVVPVSFADFPDKPIKIIVPFNAGGETDISARLLAAELEKILEQNVVVQNIAGAAGMIGTKELISSTADGYTLEVLPSGPLALHPHIREIPYNLDDFSFIGRIINSPYLLYTNKESKWDNFEQMLEDIKNNPNKYFWGSSGVGSVPFFAYHEITNRFDLKVKHVPFTDDAEAFQAMAGNRIQLYTTTAGVLSKFDIKGLAILDKQKSNLLPDIPAVNEFGEEVLYSQWMVLVGPKNIPNDVSKVLNDAMEKAVDSESFKESLRRLSLEPAYLNSQETEAFVKGESDRNAENIKTLMAAQ